MRTAITIILIAQILLSSAYAPAYDLSQTRNRKTASTTTVALVPFTERRSSEVDGMLGRLGRELRKTDGIRVLDSKKTDEVLRYYLKFVNLASSDGAVERALTEARQALVGGDYSGAARLLDGAEKKIRARFASGGTNEGLYQVHLLRAKVHHANGGASAVQREYDLLALVHPDLDLDPNLYANWERNSLKQAKERLATRRTASIGVKSNPEGSEVFLNGVHRGITPMTLKDLPAGAHVVEVKTVHYGTLLRQINLREGETSSIDAKLTRVDFAIPQEEVTIRPSMYKTDLEISRLISTLGYHLGVDKIVLVANDRSKSGDSVVYRTGDTQLGAVQKQFAGQVGEVAATMGREVKVDVLQDPAKYADQSVGSLDLMHKKRKPFYKKPLFWILVGIGAGTAGALGAILGAGGAATGGIVMGF